MRSRLVCQPLACVWPSFIKKVFLRFPHSQIAHASEQSQQESGGLTFQQFTITVPAVQRFRRSSLRMIHMWITVFMRSRRLLENISLGVKEIQLSFTKLSVICFSSLWFDKKKASLEPPQETMDIWWCGWWCRETLKKPHTSLHMSLSQVPFLWQGKLFMSAPAERINHYI